MNRTTDDSRKLQVLYGGETVKTEEGILQMPPEQAKDTEEVLNNIIIGNFQEIKVENDKNLEQILTKTEIIELEEYRRNRKTEKALERLAANQR